MNLIVEIIENRINRTYIIFLKDTPENIVCYGQEKIFNIKNNKDHLNKNRIDHIYKINDKCLIFNYKKNSKLDPNFLGQFQIIEVYTNRVKLIDDDKNTMVFNVKNIKPYFE